MLVLSIAQELCAEENNVLKDFSKTTTTQTFNLNTDGDITGRTVVEETSVVMKVKETNVYNVDSNGLEYVSSRTTETCDHGGAVKTVVEESDGVGGDLYVTAITTVERNGSTVATTYQTIDSKLGVLVVSRRVTTGIDDQGRSVTTTEERDEYGKLKVIKTVITSVE